MPIIKKQVNNNYTYVGPEIAGSTSDADYTYDGVYFQKLINQHQYTAAANYASKFVPNNEEERKQLKGYLFTLRTEGEKVEHIYANAESKPGGKDKVDASLFYDAVFSNNLNGLDENNKYKRQYERLKANLGGKGATTLEIEFKPKTRSYLGKDWLAQDNDITLDNFLNNCSIDRSELKVYPGNDGGGIISIDKSDKNFNLLAYELANFVGNNSTFNIAGPSNHPIIKGYDVNGNYIKNSLDYERKPKTIGKTLKDVYKNSKENSNLKIGYSDRPFWFELQQMYKGIQGAKDVQKELEEDIKEKTYVYESLIFGTFGDTDNELKSKYENGEIDHDAFRQALQDSDKDAYQQIKMLDLSSYSGGDIYTDFYNDEGVTTLKKVDLNFLAGLNTNFGYAKKDENYVMSYGTSGNKQGIFITILSKPQSDTQEKYNYQYKPCTIFVENLWSEKTQAAMATSPKAQALYTMNNMKHYGYGHSINDGKAKVYITDNQGNGYVERFIEGKKEKTPKTKAQIEQILNLDFTKQLAADALLDKYSNNKGQIDKEGYLLESKLVAGAIANNFYKDANRPPLNPVDYFGLGSFDPDRVDIQLDSLFTEKYNSDIYQWYPLEQFSDAYDVYEYLLSKLRGYDFIQTKE